MSSNYKEFAQQAILVIGFLGAIVFASLVFVLGQRTQIVSLVNSESSYLPVTGSIYFQILVTFNTWLWIL